MTDAQLMMLIDEIRELIEVLKINSNEIVAQLKDISSELELTRMN